MAVATTTLFLRTARARKRWCKRCCAFQASRGAEWRAAFIDFYLTERLTCALGESCAMQSLATDVARADPEARAAFEAEFRQVIEATAHGGPRAEAIALLALLSGGVSLARAAQDPALAAEIADAVRVAALESVRRSQ